jgi:hypothetical protein
MKQPPRNMPTYVKYFVDRAAVKLRPFVVNGNFNTEYIRGNQNIKIGENLIIRPKQYNDTQVYTERKVFNRINPIYLTRYSILTDNMPLAGFKPSLTTHKTITDATRGNNFLNEYMKDIDFKEKYAKMVTRADVYGVEWVKTGIDYSQGDDIGVFELTSDGKKGEYILKEGRVFIEPIPIHEIFVDNIHIEGIKDVQELVHRRPFTLQYIMSRWGIEARVEEIQDLLDEYPRYSNRLDTGSDIKYAYVYEYYKKPDSEFPNGRHTVIINDKVIYDKELPYKNGYNGERIIPFDLVTIQSVPNHLLGASVYPQLIPIQDTINSVKNRYLEYVNHIAIGQLYYWEGSLLSKQTFSTKPGKLIGLKRNARPPQPVQKTQLTNEFISYLRMLDEDMLITAGLSPLSAYGTSRSNVRTDGVVDAIAASDQNKLVNALDNISNAMIQVFKKVLYLEKERQAFILDNLGLAKKDNYVMKYNLNEVDVEQITIVNREFLMQNDQIFDKKLMQANQMGLYNAQLGLSYLSKVEMLNALKGNFLKETLDPKERANHDLIEMEHFKILNDQEVAVEKFQLHEQHIYEHDIFRLSPEMLILQENDKDRYDLLLQKIDEHIKDHERFVSQKQNENVYNNAKAFAGTARRS